MDLRSGWWGRPVISVSCRSMRGLAVFANDRDAARSTSDGSARSGFQSPTATMRDRVGGFNSNRLFQRPAGSAGGFDCHAEWRSGRPRRVEPKYRQFKSTLTILCGMTRPREHPNLASTGMICSSNRTTGAAPHQSFHGHSSRLTRYSHRNDCFTIASRHHVPCRADRGYRWLRRRVRGLMSEIGRTFDCPTHGNFAVDQKLAAGEVLFQNHQLDIHQTASVPEPMPHPASCTG